MYKESIHRLKPVVVAAENSDDYPVQQEVVDMVYPLQYDEETHIYDIWYVFLATASLEVHTLLPAVKPAVQGVWF